MPYLIGLIVVAILLAGGAWRINSTAHAKGYHERDLACVAEKADITSRHAESERQAMAQRDKARLLADGAAQEVEHLRRTLAVNSERLNSELSRRASATRQCFSPPVARLLDRPSAVPATGPGEARAPAAGASPGAGAPAAPAEGSAGDEAGTSELAAGRYIDLIRSRFEACRAQVRAVLVGTGNVPIE